MIAITKCEKDFEQYLLWLNHFRAKYTILHYKESKSFDKFKSCSGLILTGGVDIYPELYNDWETSTDKGKFIPERDGFELNLLRNAIERKIPVLGICRGCQMINVFFRGSLIYDIQTIRGVIHTKLNSEHPRYHKIIIKENSLLMKIVEKNEGQVTSSHHQAVDRIGEGLKPSAISEDNIIEAIEYVDSSQMPFLLGIQWHPERFDDFDNVFSKNIIERFIAEIK